MRTAEACAALLVASFPLLAQEGRPLFNAGPLLESSQAVSAKRQDFSAASMDAPGGSQDVGLVGAGGFLLVRLGEALESRPPLAWELRAVYRIGSSRDGATVPSFRVGGGTLAYASLSTRTSTREISVDALLRVYLGSKRRWLEGPYLMAGPAWCHVDQTVDFTASGGTGSGAAGVASQASSGEARAGLVAGLGWTMPVRYSFFNVALTWRRLNGGTVQAQQRVSLSLGWQF